MTGSIYTKQMRLTLQAALGEAGERNHAYVGTEHLFLALLAHHRSLAIAALAALGIEPKSLRDDVQRSLIPQRDGSARTEDAALLARMIEAFQPQADLQGQLSYSPRAKKVLDLSRAAAEELGHSQVGTDHLLLGLANEEDGLAAVVLSAHDATPDRLRAAVLDLRTAGGRDDEDAS